MDMGLDFGKWSFLSTGNTMNMGVFDGTSFRSFSLAVSGLTVLYRTHFYTIDFSFKLGESLERFDGNFGALQQPTKLSATRINITTDYFKKMELVYSLISRKFRYNETLTFNSTSLTNALKVSYKYNFKYTFGGLISLEKYENSNTLADVSELYTKASAFVSLSF